MITPGVGVEWRTKQNINIWTPIMKSTNHSNARNTATTTTSTNNNNNSNQQLPPPPSEPDHSYSSSPVLPPAARDILRGAAEARMADLAKGRDQQKPLTEHVQWC